MTKKGPLGKAEAYYVEGHCNTQDARQIAKDLDRPIATIQKYIDKFRKDNPEEHRLTAGSQMARREGVVTMTENASSISDSKSRGNSPERTRQCTVAIKDE